MPAFIDRTGETYNNIIIVEELGNNKVRGRCKICGEQYEYNKSGLVANRIACKNKDCTNKVAKRPGKYKCLIGETVNGFFVINEMTGVHSSVKVRCIYCGTEQIKDKYSVKAGISKCINNDCINKMDRSNCKKHTIDYTGKIYNNIKIIKELGGNKVEATCQICRKTYVYDKRALITRNCHCKNKKCQNSKREYRINIVNNIYNDMTVIEDYPTESLIKCNQCGATKVAQKNAIIANMVRCPNILCKNSRAYMCRKNLKDMIFGDLKVIDEYTNGIVNVQCIKCKYTFKRNRDGLNQQSKCRNCGIFGTQQKIIEGHTINNVKVLKYEYKGRDEKYYYSCICNKCKEEVILSYEDIFTYDCTRNT